MGIVINKEQAKHVLLEEAEREATGEHVPKSWETRIRRLSLLCEEANSKTHIAFLGTALLARSTNLQADVYSIKRKSGTPGAYSARGLATNVLAAHAPRLRIHLGVTKREPLNNQPYFRLDRADRKSLLDATHGRASEAVDYLLKCLGHLDQLASEKTVRSALRAFIRVRRGYFPDYGVAPGNRAKLSPVALVDAVTALITDRSEGGRRAQATAAGLIDVLVGDPDRVEMGAINDPDRHLPGDIGVKAVVGDFWAQVLEVRDKRVSEGDAWAFLNKCREKSVTQAAILAVRPGQVGNLFDRVEADALNTGVFLRTFTSWRDFILEVIYWNDMPWPDVVDDIIARVRVRLIQTEASAEGVELWDTLTGSDEDENG